MRIFGRACASTVAGMARVPSTAAPAWSKRRREAADLEGWLDAVMMKLL
jgi:hypothetical protein